MKECDLTMAEILKDAVAKQAHGSDRELSETVAALIAEVRARGEAAVRDLSRRFDGWDPESFRLSDGEIQRAIADLDDRVLDDIRFAQEQIGNFARVQREALTDVEVETLPGVVLGHRNRPVENVGAYVPGGRYPMVASAHMSVLTAKVAGVPRLAITVPAPKGVLNPMVLAAAHIAGVEEIYRKECELIWPLVARCTTVAITAATAAGCTSTRQASRWVGRGIRR
jgi:sulfopropanediol 3-dehydrogenase